MKKWMFLLIPLALASLFCSFSDITGSSPDVSAIVNATLTAFAAQQPAATSQPGTSQTTGAISGQLGYPSEIVPPLKIYAFLIGSDQYFYVETSLGQNTYKIENLPEGKYNVVAYTIGGDGFPEGLSGAYTQAVICGMGSECADHTLVDVVVFGGEVSPDASIFDWLQPDFPPQPGTVSASVPQYGTISGNLMYPASEIPPMQIVAFNLDTGVTYSVGTPAGTLNYQIENLPPGRYHVVAYAMTGDGSTPGLAGGYSAAVPCGLSAQCTDHNLLDVQVIGGSATQNVTPADFYAPEGAFPPLP